MGRTQNFLYLALLIVTVKTVESLPGGYSQVGFSIYKDREEYDRARNPGLGSPHASSQNGKVVVTYAVGHPGGQYGQYDRSGADLSQTYYDLTSHFGNHHQHQKQVENFRQNSGALASAAAPPPPPPPQRQVYSSNNYYSNAQPNIQVVPQAPRTSPVVAQNANQFYYTIPEGTVVVPAPNNPPAPAVHYMNPYLHVAPQPQQQQQFQLAPVAAPVQSQQPQGISTATAQGTAYSKTAESTAQQNSLDLSKIIPYKFKNNPALTRPYSGSSSASTSKDAPPKAEVVKQNSSPDAAINAALDDRFPVQYY